jgi:hypothetical protein
MADFGSVTFKELHLFPRTLFAIGAALLISSLVTPKCTLAVLALGLIFFAVGFNILYDLVRSCKQVFVKKPDETPEEAGARKWNESVQRSFLWGECVISILASLVAFCWVAHRYQCGLLTK